MFYTAYFKQGVPSASRPITFLFNGGPGSSTVWLRMGAFGPVRVVTADGRHTAAPYCVVNNDQSLLDASDLVFIDAPGTGFSRIAGKDKEKSFYGVDQDIDAFCQFIFQFLSQYDRWSSPKYVFGESYGTMRGAGLALALQNKDIDLNGVIMLSDILNWDFMPDDPQLNPGIDMPYIVSLPTYAATAWYSQGRRTGRELQPFLAEVEAFATGEYATALLKGNDLPDAERQRIAERLSAYTGLTVPYLLKTNLRIEYGAFQKELLAGQEATTGTLDTRFVGATLDPLAKVASYDPQSAAISAAYLAAWNGYVRSTLHYGQGVEYQIRHPDLFQVGLQARAAGRQRPADHAAQRASRPRRRDEAEPGHESDGQRRLLRRLDALFRRQDGDAALPVPPRATGQYRVSLLREPATWSTRICRRWSRCTTMSRTSSGGRAGRGEHGLNGRCLRPVRCNCTSLCRIIDARGSHLWPAAGSRCDVHKAAFAKVAAVSMPRLRADTRLQVALLASCAHIANVRLEALPCRHHAPSARTTGLF